MKILLVAVNAKYIHSNLGIYSLRRYVKQYGYTVEMKEFTINQQIEAIQEEIFLEKPDVICFSCYIWNISIIRQLAKELHKVLPNTEIWLGGPEVTYNASQVVKEWQCITGVMRGEGEATFLELVQYYIERKTALSEIAGITWRQSEAIIENPSRKPMDLSTIPFPYDDLHDFAHRIIYYESSRGCPFSCSYCLSSVDKKLRFRSLELVKEELRFFLEQKVQQVKFVDRTFNCLKDHSREIWNYLMQHDNGITNFHFEVAADLLDEEDYTILRKMRPGLIQLEIGVQTTNQITLKEIRRNMDFNKVSAVVKTIDSGNNIHQHLDLIAGLPYEDYESFISSFNDVYALHPEQLQLGFLKVLKGSWMWENQKEYGLVYRDQEPYEVLYTNWISYEELLKLKRVEEMVEVYYNSGQFRHTLRRLESKFETPFVLYDELGKFYDAKCLRGISHSRAKRYEILLAFMEMQKFADIELFKELLTLDYYMRENAKSRPSWASEKVLEPKEMIAVYEPLYSEKLAHYEGYDPRQIRRMTHLECFEYDVLGSGEKKACKVLFDYLRRDPLMNDAQCLILEE